MVRCATERKFVQFGCWWRDGEIQSLDVSRALEQMFVGGCALAPHAGRFAAEIGAPMKRNG